MTLSFRQNQSQRTRSDMNGLKYTRPRHEHPRHYPQFCCLSLSNKKRVLQFNLQFHMFFVTYMQIIYISYIYIHIIYSSPTTLSSHLQIWIFQHQNQPLHLFHVPRLARGRFDAWSSERVKSWSLVGFRENLQDSTAVVLVFSRLAHGRTVDLCGFVCFHMI